MAEIVKHCPWGTTPDGETLNVTACTSQCALWLDGACSFAWLGRWAKTEIEERERQAILAENWAVMRGD